MTRAVPGSSPDPFVQCSSLAPCEWALRADGTLRSSKRRWWCAAVGSLPASSCDRDPASRPCALITGEPRDIRGGIFMPVTVDVATAGPAQRSLCGIRHHGLSAHGCNTFLLLIGLLWHFGACGQLRRNPRSGPSSAASSRGTVAAFVADGAITVAVNDAVFGHEGMMRWAPVRARSARHAKSDRAALDSLGL